MTNFKVGFVLALAIASALAQYQSPQTVEDDGSYIPEKYEKPWEYNAQIHENPNAQAQQPTYQTYQQPSYQRPASPVTYQSQPAPQYYQTQPAQVYQPQPAPAFRAQPTYTAGSRSLSDPRNAAILSEARYLNNDGKFGAQYSQDDGVEFKEESDPDGTRRGTYSYIDPSGQRKTVSYTAGKDGFQATGDHLPSVGPAAAAPAPAPASYQPQQQRSYQAPQVYESQPQDYQPQPVYRPQAQPAPAANSGYTFTSTF